MLLPVAQSVISRVQSSVFQARNGSAPGPVDAANLVEAWDASSLSELSDGALVPSWPGLLGVLSADQATEASQPTFWSDIGGRPAVLFATDFLETAAVLLPQVLTTYALLRVAVVPVSTQNFLNQDEAASGAGRSWHSTLVATGTVRAVSFTGGGGGQVDTTTATIAADTWDTAVIRRTASEIEAFLGASSDGPSAITAPNAVTQPITFGQRGVGGENYLGYMSAVRIYAANHDEATRAAVIAEMLG